jgi:manganese/zinc/iron transport system ATP- binding protein
MKEAFTVSQLTVNYDKVPVLWDVSFAIESGRMAGIIGPNGAGKSTLLKAALGIVKPLGGKAVFFGLPLKKARKKVAYVPQRSSVDWDFPVTVLDVVIMGRYGELGYFRWLRGSDKQAALRALEMVGMIPFKDKQIGELSGGQQQRLFLARALVQEADLYLLDEPFAGIDLATEQAIIALLGDLKRSGKTIVMVHHDLNTVEAYFDDVAMLNTSLIAFGKTASVFHAENIRKTFGRNLSLLGEVVKLSEEKSKGSL